MIIFVLISLIISLIYQNWIGVGCVALIFMFISLMLYYRQYINQDVFEFIVDLLIALSDFMGNLWIIRTNSNFRAVLCYDHFNFKSI